MIFIANSFSAHFITNLNMYKRTNVYFKIFVLEKKLFVVFYLKETSNLFSFSLFNFQNKQTYIKIKLVKC